MIVLPHGLMWNRPSTSHKKEGTMQTKQKHACRTLDVVCVMIALLGIASITWAQGYGWTEKGAMPTARWGHSASVVDGKIYAIGGTTGMDAPGLSTAEEYHPAADTWTTKADMPTQRTFLSTSVVNGKIYAIGGMTEAPPAAVPGLSTVEAYDPGTDTWTAKADMPTQRLGHSTSMVNGKIYAIGGLVQYPGPGLSTVEEYDPGTDTWTAKADMPTPRCFLSASVVNGKIYAIGGMTEAPGGVPGLSTVEEYDPGRDTWTTKADMPTQRCFLSASVVNGKIYAIGGWGNHCLSTVEEYDPGTDTWANKSEMPTPGMGLSTSAVGGRVYAIGGTVCWSDCASTVEAYDPALDPPEVSIQALFWGPLKATFQ
jgi:N-acetylneuraminic acid mutarotase